MASLHRFASRVPFDVIVEGGEIHIQEHKTWQCPKHGLPCTCKPPKGRVKVNPVTPDFELPLQSKPASFIIAKGTNCIHARPGMTQHEAWANAVDVTKHGRAVLLAYGYTCKRVWVAKPGKRK